MKDEDEMKPTSTVRRTVVRRKFETDAFGMTFTVEIDDEAAFAFANVIRRLRPEQHGVQLQAWYRALDAISPHLPVSSSGPPA